MKKDVHPKYMVTQVKCGCGNTFTTRSTLPELKVDICNVCHPFYTGKLKFIDTAGRIEKFKNRLQPQLCQPGSTTRRRERQDTSQPDS
jgi:large subunit ribosomal protein L31